VSHINLGRDRNVNGGPTRPVAAVSAEESVFSVPRRGVEPRPDQRSDREVGVGGATYARLSSSCGYRRYTARASQR